MRRKIAAQLDTLIMHGARHAVLSAFGCGVYNNNPAQVAAIYKDELQRRRGSFDCIAFAIVEGGGPKKASNFEPFQAALGQLQL